jgi:2,3-bisphosphoglycerate-dependent phosphoglycerate mutase
MMHLKLIDLKTGTKQLRLSRLNNCPLFIASCLLLFSFLSVNVSAQESAITTFILVRHAEKVADGSKDPELTEQGHSRALRLADMLQRQPIAAIFSTNFKRTQNTVAALAQKVGLQVQLYEPFKDEEITKMIELYKGKTIVIVGHSNNVPWIANLLLGQKTFEDYKDNYYENILIVNVGEKGTQTSTLQIKY